MPFPDNKEDLTAFVDDLDDQMLSDVAKRPCFGRKTHKTKKPKFIEPPIIMCSMTCGLVSFCTVGFVTIVMSQFHGNRVEGVTLSSFSCFLISVLSLASFFSTACLPIHLHTAIPVCLCVISIDFSSRKRLQYA